MLRSVLLERVISNSDYNVISSGFVAVTSCTKSASGRISLASSANLKFSVKVLSREASAGKVGQASRTYCFRFSSDPSAGSETYYEHDHSGGRASEDIGRLGGGLARADKISGHVIQSDQYDQG